MRNDHLSQDRAYGGVWNIFVNRNPYKDAPLSWYNGPLYRDGQRDLLRSTSNLPSIVNPSPSQPEFEEIELLKESINWGWWVQFNDSMWTSHILYTVRESHLTYLILMYGSYPSSSTKSNQKVGPRHTFFNQTHCSTKIILMEAMGLSRIVEGSVVVPPFWGIPSWHCPYTLSIYEQVRGRIEWYGRQRLTVCGDNVRMEFPRMEGQCLPYCSIRPLTCSYFVLLILLSPFLLQGLILSLDTDPVHMTLDHFVYCTMAGQPLAYQSLCSLGVY
jgi:hypothetical protein